MSRPLKFPAFSNFQNFPNFSGNRYVACIWTILEPESTTRLPSMQTTPRTYPPATATANDFGYTTKQAARAIGSTPEAMRAQVQRTGSFRGVVPIRLPNGRIVWPRPEILRLAGLSASTVNRRTVIDLRATLPWLETIGLPTDDPGAYATALALCNPTSDASRDPAELLDWLCALREWIRAGRARLRAASDRMTPEQRTNGQRLLALAIAGAVSDLPAETLAQAVSDVSELRA